MMALACGGDPFVVSRPKLLIVEGDDDKHVLFQLLTSHLGLTDIDIRDTEGTGNLRNYLDLLPSISGYANIKTIGIVQDSDETPEKTFAAIVKAVKKHYDVVPEAPGSFVGSDRRVGILVLASGAPKCTLEHVCLQSVESSQQCLECVEAYYQCLVEAGADLHPNEAKHKAHAFLAALPNPTRNLGQAAYDGVWDFRHEAWQPLIDFIKTM
jgi:hypothetical protein